ncbi:ClpP class periplasmic serine protease [Thioflavicoccus mobilis 8321]|uniref:ClpP class periplasmic serine protease n=1 Tax=Thioflavicoccus mobilis 8321 TaxID=765912 RepID=L0GQQ0_9GAMM|nr:protease SohB [Thioflavicoccus mobilis]AGA89063.1 ClpP class periplasmic serine protease [Thioflavicoccus mobilis 8321]
MIDLLSDYGLFLAKTVTLVLAIAIPLLLLMRSRATPADRERLEITDLGDRYREMGDALKEASLPRKGLRQLRRGQRHRKRAVETDQPRLFVLDFHGDLKATDVASLREAVTVVLLDAGPGDEVLVRLENAGGVVSEHGLAASQLVRIRERGIPLTVAVDKVAASGGYLMACVADRLLAAPFAVVGSIGAVAGLPNFRRLLERHGVDFELHTAGAYKRTLTLFGENTEAGREKVREQLETIHRLFKDFIAEYRPSVDLERVATGEYWYGPQALELGLVDRIQTSDDYLLSARERARIYQVKYTKRKRPMERLVASMEGRLQQLLGP